MKQHHSAFNVFLLALVVLIDAMGWGIAFPSFAPIFLRDTTHIFHVLPSLFARDVWYELTLGLYCLCWFLMSPLLGSLSDRYGRKIILVVSLFGNMLGFVVSALGVLNTSITMILLGRIIAGCTAGSLPIAQAAMMDISSDEDKPKRLGYITIANISGFAIGPAIGSFFLTFHFGSPAMSYSNPFWVTAIVAFIGALLILTKLKDTYTVNPDVKVSFWTGFVNMRDAMVHSTIRPLSIIFLGFMLGWSMFFSMAPLLLVNDFHWSGGAVGGFVVYLAVILGLGVLFAMPRLTKRFSMLVICKFSFLALVLLCLFFPFIHSDAGLWLLGLLGIFAPFIYIAIATMLSNSVSAQEQGKVMGILGSLIALCWAVGPLLISLAVKFGILSAYMTAAVLMAISLVLCFRMRKKAV